MASQPAGARNAQSVPALNPNSYHQPSLFRVTPLKPKKQNLATGVHPPAATGAGSENPQFSLPESTKR
jgi:hypothetical protein